MRKALIGAAALVFACAAIVAVTGGLDTRAFGIVLRARDPMRIVTVGVALLVVQSLVFRVQFTRDTDRAAGWLRRHAPWIASAAAIVLAVHAIHFGSFTAGGSDAYGYVSEAYGWASGDLPHPLSLPLALPFPSSDLLQTPLGYHVGQQPHTMVPTYAPGLPLLMAIALRLAGACGPFLVVPACAALLVWVTFLFARRAAGPVAGAIAAVVILVSPIVLYQSLWPMSDVPAGAFWTAAAVSSLGERRRSAFITGCCTAIGLLIRPNLALLALVPFIFVALGARGRERWVRMALFCAAVLPVPLFIGALNALWYGSPFNSGYGSASALYSFENVRANLALYPLWLWQSESGWVLLGLIPLLPVLRRHADGRTVCLAVALALGTFACYVEYSPFDAWWYLRFMLPGLGALAVLIAAGIVAIARAVPAPWGRIAAAVCLWLLLANAFVFARSTGVFGRMQASERRYIDIGELVARTLPDNALVFTEQHSGSVRFYGGRMTIRYDFMDKELAARAPAALEQAGFHPYMVIDDWEVTEVQRQFGFPPGSRLPWPVLARMRELGGMTVFDLATHPGDLSPAVLEPGGSHWCAPRAALVLRARQ